MGRQLPLGVESVPETCTFPETQGILQRYREDGRCSVLIIFLEQRVYDAPRSVGLCMGWAKSVLLLLWMVTQVYYCFP